MGNTETCYLCKQPIKDEVDRTCISEAAHKDCARDYDSPPDQYHYSLYFELLHAVESKYPGESRHETALRYIRDAERCITKPKETPEYQVHSNREENRIIDLGCEITIYTDLRKEPNNGQTT